jgi:hypothetical protein
LKHWVAGSRNAVGVTGVPAELRGVHLAAGPHCVILDRAQAHDLVFADVTWRMLLSALIDARCRWSFVEQRSRIEGDPDACDEAVVDVAPVDGRDRRGGRGE